MQLSSKKEIRMVKFAAIRKSISLNPVLQCRANRLEEKMEKKLIRKSSMQIGDQSDLCSSKMYESNPSDDQDNFKSLFNDRYQLGQKAGQGAHGVVKKCEDRQTGQICAVKAMKLDREHICYLKKNFMEVKSLKHPNILSYKALFFEPRSSKCYLVTDYLPYPDLQHQDIQSEEELKIITFQLLKTLKYLHQHKICHRDIKPDNILYDKQNRTVKLIDFGISKKVEERGRKREMLTLTGTPYFRAPEMFQGGGYDQMVDLWALGVTIFKLMTGFTPFESEYHMETIDNIMKGEVIFPNILKFQCSQFLKNLVRRLLKRSKKDRLSASQAMKDVWLLDLTVSNDLDDDDFCRSMSQNKPFFDFGNHSPLRFNQSHSPLTYSSKNVNTTECTKSFKQIFEHPEKNIYGMDENQVFNFH